MFIGQSKIYSYLNPNKAPGARPPLQEENSVMYHEVKCQGKTLKETYRKGAGKIDLWLVGLGECAPTPSILALSSKNKSSEEEPKLWVLNARLHTDSAVTGNGNVL